MRNLVVYCLLHIPSNDFIALRNHGCVLLIALKKNRTFSGDCFDFCVHFSLTDADSGLGITFDQPPKGSDSKSLINQFRILIVRAFKNELKGIKLM